MSLFHILLPLLMFAPQDEQPLLVVASGARKFVYQKDVSEYCRRRVVPSVFISSQVVEAQSEMLQFSQLEVPYSCFISIRSLCRHYFGVYRTESGSNIVLVIQIELEEGLHDSCRENSNQLLVYEMGETFGGYWGPLPDTVLGSYPVRTKYYTVKTTSTTAASYTDTEQSETDVESTTKVSTRLSSKSSSQEDYVEMEIPLVNVSAVLVRDGSEVLPGYSFGIDETFDFIYGVTPRPNFPLMGNTATKRIKKYKYKANRRLNFNKKQPRLFSVEDAAFDMNKQTFTNISMDIGRFASTTKLTSLLTDVSKNKENVEQIGDSWHYVEDLMSRIKETKSSNLNSSEEYGNERRNITTLLKNISDTEHNSSIYLLSNISEYNEDVSKKDKIKQDVVTTRRNDNFSMSPQDSTENNVIRKKRYIQSISVKRARPHAMTTHQRDMVTTSEPMYSFSDIQDFAQLVELQDDEMNGRVALRYLGKYVGNTLYNICEFSVAKKARHVLLLNSSRIVISINRFTMKRMSVMATPAHTLRSPDARCDTNQIECQVSGARVCIDSTNACDGVPNCGAHDIYDEDRLRCGAFKGLQHNVCLAAFTFLAVLLTMLYTVHYWLKRCVPKVSDAFFIYTDGTENILYLDSIMRSPTDVDDTGSKMVYHTHIFDNDVDSNEILKTEKRNTVIYKVKNLLTYCFCRKKSKRGDRVEMTALESFSQTAEPKTTFSFTELELSRMAMFTRDAGIQTGDSLEIEFSKEMKQKYEKNLETTQNIQENSVNHNIAGAKDDFLRKKSHDGELNMLKFLRDAKTGSVQWTSPKQVDGRETSKYDVAVGNEREIHTTLYESTHERTMRQSLDIPFTSSVDVTLEKPGTSGYNKKRLRFEEDDIEKNRPCVLLGEGKALNQETLDIVEEDQEHSSGRDFMRFWGSTKGKKSKKKSHLQLR